MFYKYESVPVNLMKIENTYHYERDLDERRVMKIVRQYDDSQVNQMILSYRDGAYYIIDGQHTAEATRRAKGETTKLNSKVFHGLTIEGEADLFYKLNTNKKPLSIGEKLNAARLRGDEGAVHYIRLMEMHNFPYVYSIKKNGRNVFLAHDSGLRALRMFGENAFCTALDVMNETRDVTFYQGRCLEGLCLLLCKSDVDIDIALLIKAINETGADMLKAKIENQKKLSSGKQAVRDASAIVFGTLYNSKKRKSKIDLLRITGKCD